MMCEEGKSFYIWLLQVICLLGLLVLCLWLALRPNSPSFSIVVISIDRPSDQNGTIFYSLEIGNPNKDSSIYYDDIILSFLYGQQEDKVGDATVGSFHQGTSKSRIVSDIVNAKPGPFKPLFKAISNATAELKASLTTRYRYKTWGVRSKFHRLLLKGILPIDSDGKLSRKKKKYPLTRNSKKLGRSKVKKH
ncbi:putative Late embryogenesis abundant protein, LEA-14 [Medicago truncatula]|uniref:Late embryogenesis abundant protein n=1 Tax=Medicago truncatula TaxID=3880 RepID=G7KSR2_MEDTR|nr:NDR1/HIN1-like protein 2 [Medicago truncatula]AES82163.1 late embryogenesis abundant protein [Medicago truncatula]RHN49000.1 putative Late embryogenesis abundant protein, LEA-14 [Medicago truncatula]